jgi:hypothetical protein
MKNNIIILLITLIISTSIFGQEKDSLKFDRFKKFLPYSIKGIQDIKQSDDNISERTSGVFEKPWTTKKMDINLAKSLCDKIVQSNIVRVKKTSRGNPYLNILSTVNLLSTDEKVNSFPNVYIEILNAQINDNNGKLAVNSEDNDPINSPYNENGTVELKIPLKEEYEHLNGKVEISVNEFDNVVFKELNKNNESVKFDLGTTEGIELLKIEKNRAYLLFPSQIPEIIIKATNKSNEKFAENGKLTVPKGVYEFSKGQNLTEESIQNFINTISYEEAFNSPKVVILETNGIIEKLYVYLKQEPKRLSTTTVEIKL